MLDKKIIDGIHTWLGARMLEAINNNKREVFETYKLLVDDMKTSEKQGEYPWEVLIRGFQDRAAGKVK